MKYILIVVMFMLPLYAGVNCIDNSEHLQRTNDKKEWHPIECNCSCEIIQAGVCTECGHMQEAHPLIVIESSRTKKVMRKLAVQMPKTLQDFVNNSVKPYLENN
ncbi:MAG TPA: hypothetical protein VKU36_06085 [Candidatus Babeliales bacterium]|jgi:hypothetical protein|nr:hypothetical protein [Candidatus Babeliales bacterium]